MEVRAPIRFSPATSDVVDVDEFMDVKKGPWTAEEDALLANYVSVHGEGRWNSVARFAGLKRTGKSCRLRWLNYLRPDLRHGNITIQEQLLILELHSRWGNRWSKIAQFLPGRTDNEIKNYWRTRVQKQAKQMKCDVNSKQFRDAMHHVWIPRLRERMESSSTNTSSGHAADPTGHQVACQTAQSGSASSNPSFSYYDIPVAASESYSDNTQASLGSYLSESYDRLDGSCIDSVTEWPWSWPDNSLGYSGSGGREYEEDLMMESLWNQENIEFLQQQLFDD